MEEVKGQGQDFFGTNCAIWRGSERGSGGGEGEGRRMNQVRGEEGSEGERARENNKQKVETA